MVQSLSFCGSLHLGYHGSKGSYKDRLGPWEKVHNYDHLGLDNTNIFWVHLSQFGWQLGCPSPVQSFCGSRQCVFELVLSLRNTTNSGCWNIFTKFRIYTHSEDIQRNSWFKRYPVNQFINFSFIKNLFLIAPSRFLVVFYFISM